MSGIDLFLRVDEELAAVLEFVQRVGIRCTGFHGDERTVVTFYNLAFPRLVLQEAVRHNCLAGTHVHHVGTHTHDATARNGELQMHAVVDHLHLRHLAFVGGDELDNLAAALFRGVDCEGLHRLAFDAVDLFDDDLRLAYLQLIALATHGLDEHTQVQYSAAEHTPAALFGTFLYAQCQVLLQLFVQSVLYMAAGDELTVLSEERAVVDAEGHTHRRLVNSNRLESLGGLCVAHGVADLEAVDTDHRADVAVLDDVGLHVPHARERVQLFDLRLDHRAVFFGEGDCLPVLELAAVYASDGYTAYVGVIVERSDQHLRRTGVVLRSRDVLDDGIHEVGQVRCGFLPVFRHPAVLGGAVQRLEIQLVVGGVEVAHQVEHLFLHLVRTAVQFIYFVDYNDRFEPQFQRFLQHKPCLRHRAFKRIHEQQYAVRHVQYALHLAAEVGVPRSVDDIDFRAFVFDGYVLCKNGYASFAFEVVVVQDKFFRLVAESRLLLADHVSRIKHFVYECCFPVVYVCNNSYVSYVLHTLLNIHLAPKSAF